MVTTRNGNHMSEESDESSDEEVAIAHGCSKFSEVEDPVAAMMWISRMEVAFKEMNCSDEDKVTYGVCMLGSEALVWWDTVKDASEPEAPTKMTWSRFKQVFKDEFYPLSVELELVQEYRTLKQEEDETVQEYTTRFEKLWWFFWDHLTSENRLIYLYVGGLTREVKGFITASDMTTLDNAIKAARLATARVVENENNRRLEERKRKRRTCTNCGKRHEGVCRYGSKECYQCGKLGHFARECGSVQRKCYS